MEIKWNCFCELNANLITWTMTEPDHLIVQAFSIVKRREKIKASFFFGQFSSLEEKQIQVQSLIETAIHKCSDQMLFRKILQNSQENILTGAHKFTKERTISYFPVNFTKPFRSPLLLNTCQFLLQQRPGKKRAKSKYYQIFHWCKRDPMIRLNATL